MYKHSCHLHLQYRIFYTSFENLHFYPLKLMLYKINDLSHFLYSHFFGLFISIHSLHSAYICGIAKYIFLYINECISLKLFLWAIYLALLLLSYFTLAFFSLGLLLWYIFPVFSSLAMSSTFPLCPSHFAPHSCWSTMSLTISSSFFRRAIGV